MTQARAADAPPPSPLERLQAEPHLFSLDHAATVLAGRDDPLTLAYAAPARTGYPAGEVTGARPDRRELVTPTFGLIGPGGALPRHMTAMVAADLRQRLPASQALMTLLARRFVALFVKAGRKYRPTLDPVPAERALAAAIGLGTPHLAGRTAVPDGVLLHHAGHLAARTRSAERLRAMLAEETGGTVSIEEFVGGWTMLPDTERTRLPGAAQPRGQHARLGQGAAIGAAAWDAQRRFVVRIGPLSRARFEALLPGRPAHARLMDLARLHVGPEQDFSLNLRLHPRKVPAVCLGGPARLGWTSWLAGPPTQLGRGGEPTFGPGAGARAVGPGDIGGYPG